MEKLRFKDFKFVKNGVLSDICEISTGKFNNEKIGNHNVYGANGIIGKTNKISHVGRNIIVGRVGSAGKSMIVDGKYYVSDNAFILKGLQIDYTYAYIEHLKLEQYSFGSVQKLIKSSDLKKIEINIISNEEKVKIGEYFYNLNFLINNNQRQLELMEKYKEDLLDKIFNQKIRFKDENGCDYPEWEKAKLGEVAEIYQPKTISKADFVGEGLYLVYGANGVIGKYNKYNHKQEQVLVSCRGAKSGALNYSHKESWITGNSLVVNIDEYQDIVNKKYIYYFLHNLDLHQLITGTAIPQITGASLKHIFINLPCLDEQTKIANLFSNLDLEINILKNSIKNLKEFKIDMLEKMF